MADFQRLDAYQCSLHFLRWLAPQLLTVGREHRDLADQLRRASSSIPLNIAEATGRRGKDRVQHNSIAYGSAKECLAALEVAEVFGLLNEGKNKDGKEMLERLIAMLAVMSGVAGKSATEKRSSE
jgi:four helix bundle protein